MLDDLNHIRQTMAANGQGPKPLWIYEVGWGSDPVSAANGGYTKGMTGQRKILIQAFNALLQKRSVWRIGKVLWLTSATRQAATGHLRLLHLARLLTNAFQPSGPGRRSSASAADDCAVALPDDCPVCHADLAHLNVPGPEGRPERVDCMDGNSTRGSSSIRGLPALRLRPRRATGGRRDTFTLFLRGFGRRLRPCFLVATHHRQEGRLRTFLNGF